MNTRKGVLFVLAMTFPFMMSCNDQPATSTTRGSGKVECDESLFPTMKFQAEDFHNTYPDGTISIRSVEAREAVVDFVNDSIRVIVLGRPLNADEKEYLKKANIEVEGYKVALDAVAVILNRQQADSMLTIGEVDSIFSGVQTRWATRKKALIDAYVGDVNSSTDEVFREMILHGRRFGPTVTRVKSSGDLIEAVKKGPNAIGLVGLSWLHGHEQEVRVCRLGGGKYQPDSTEVPGQFFSPAQAHVLRKYYPISRDVYMYTREPRRDVTYGFIAYVKDRKGQQNFINDGLVPGAQPVRIVETTSQKVQ